MTFKHLSHKLFPCVQPQKSNFFDIDCGILMACEMQIALRERHYAFVTLDLLKNLDIFDESVGTNTPNVADYINSLSSCLWYGNQDKKMTQKCKSNSLIWSTENNLQYVLLVAAILFKVGRQNVCCASSLSNFNSEVKKNCLWKWEGGNESSYH